MFGGVRVGVDVYVCVWMCECECVSGMRAKCVLKASCVEMVEASGTCSSSRRLGLWGGWVMFELDVEVRGLVQWLMRSVWCGRACRKWATATRWTSLCACPARSYWQAHGAFGLSNSACIYRHAQMVQVPAPREIHRSTYR